MVAPGGPVAYYGRANSSAHAAHSRTEYMNDFIDNVSRILATPMPRRKAMKLFGGAFAAAVVAAVGVQPAEAAACTAKQVSSGSVTCGNGSNATCCKGGCCYGPATNKICCSGFLATNGSCLSKKPSSGTYTSC